MSNTMIAADWRADRKPGAFRAPSAQAVGFAPRALAEALSEYERGDRVRAEAAGALDDARDELARSRDRLVEAAVMAIVEKQEAPPDVLRDLQDALERAERQNAAANIAAHGARQTLRHALAEHGDEWIGTVGEATGAACAELLGLTDRVEELLAPVGLMTSVSRFVRAAERDKLCSPRPRSTCLSRMHGASLAECSERATYSTTCAPSWPLSRTRSIRPRKRIHRKRRSSLAKKTSPPRRSSPAAPTRATASRSRTE